MTDSKINKSRKKQLKEWGKYIFKSFAGFTKDDIEPLFERFVIPIYVFASRRPNEEGKWKIVNRETGEEYSAEQAIYEVNNLYQTFNKISPKTK